ncbi:hypothetical protein MRX96_046831 [Rhipicephalus microplus]
METTPKRRSNAAGHAGRRLASFFGEKIEGRPREKMGGWPERLAVPVRCPALGCSFYRNSIMNSLPRGRGSDRASALFSGSLRRLGVGDKTSSRRPL